jgi:hypothetical protein
MACKEFANEEDIAEENASTQEQMIRPFLDGTGL